MYDTWIFNSILLFQTVLSFTPSSSFLHFIHLVDRIHGNGMMKTIGSSFFIAVIDKYRNMKKMCVNVYMCICTYVYVYVYMCVCLYIKSIFVQKLLCISGIISE